MKRREFLGHDGAHGRCDLARFPLRGRPCSRRRRKGNGRCAGRDAAHTEDSRYPTRTGEGRDSLQGARAVRQRHAVHRGGDLDDRHRRQPHRHTGTMQGVSVELRGQELRELSPEGTGPSGIGVDEDNRTIWIGSTYSREIIRADAKTGETIEKHFTPGAGVIYRRTTDIPARPDTYGAEGARGSGDSGARRSAAGGGEAAAVVTRPRVEAGQKGPGHEPTVSASDAAARLPEIPDLRHREPARTDSRPRTGSCGCRCLRGG